MKKILILSALFLLTSLCCLEMQAQNVKTKFIASSRGSAEITYTQVAGVDTVKIALADVEDARFYIVNASNAVTALNDSLAVNVISTTKAKRSAHYSFYFLADGSNRKVRFIGSNFVTDTPLITVLAGKTANVHFRVNATGKLEYQSHFIKQ